VGSTAVQLARSVGAHVIGTGRSRARSLVLGLGADRFVDLEEPGWEEAVGQVDLVYDIVGGEIVSRSIPLVKPGGTLVTVKGPPPPHARQDIRALFFIRQPNRAQLVELARQVDAGQLRPPPIAGVYPLPEARNAFKAKSNQRTPGKVILRP
jgi:NADPH:quinone reductase-like Zn-dependent oxidoreductase